MTQTSQKSYILEKNKEGNNTSPHSDEQPSLSMLCEEIKPEIIGLLTLSEVDGCNKATD